MAIQHVLVPLDQSSLAEAALDYVRSIIHDEGQVTLLFVAEHAPTLDTTQVAANPGIAPLHGVVTPMSPAPAYNARLTLWEEARAYLERTAERLRSPHRTVNYLIREGQAAEQILDVAAQLKVDAIIMATHGRSGLSRLVMGSVANKVVSDAPCPVFLIPQKALRKHHPR